MHICCIYRCSCHSSPALVSDLCTWSLHPGEDGWYHNLKERHSVWVSGGAEEEQSPTIPQLLSLSVCCLLVSCWLMPHSSIVSHKYWNTSVSCCSAEGDTIHHFDLGLHSAEPNVDSSISLHLLCEVKYDQKLTNRQLPVLVLVPVLIPVLTLIPVNSGSATGSGSGSITGPGPAPSPAYGSGFASCTGCSRGTGSGSGCGTYPASAPCTSTSPHSGPCSSLGSVPVQVPVLVPVLI